MRCKMTTNKYGEYDAETLDEIKQGVDLLEYAEQYMDFKKQGDVYFTHCPKHEDKTPSLAFYPKQNTYHCFSCGLHGDIINFLRDFEGLSFKDAVEKAAKLSNVDLNALCHSDTFAFLKRLERLRTSTQKVIQHEILDKKEYEKYRKEPIKEWLDEGISQEVMDMFGVRADVFQNRIVYPVYDIDGNLINIKGRTRYDNFKKLRIPKYINYYSVGCMDYFQGLNITLPYVKEKNEIIIFESIKSVMLAYGWGYRNCASAEKHTLTTEQINLLAKLRVNVVLAYDSDVDYWQPDVLKNIEKLKLITNLYIVTDPRNLLGGKQGKNAPVDLGRTVWEELYHGRKKVV